MLSISLSKISELSVPLPPAAEAEIIIDRLRDALDSGADNHRDISEARDLSSAIRQSILKAAFEGRLVSQVLLSQHPSSRRAAQQPSKETERGGGGREQRRISFTHHCRA